MQMPVMQAEWQRRQTQRSVWALLGLLALLTHAPAALDRLPLGQAPCPEISSVRATDQHAEPGSQRSGGRVCVTARYWRAVGAAASTTARLRLSLHAAARPTVDSHDLYLRRFLRPPTA